MNILIISYGSHGDVQPYIALGKGLQTAGVEIGWRETSLYLLMLLTHADKQVTIDIEHTNDNYY